MDNVITSTASGNSLMFSWYDYVLFSLLLLLNAAIGIYFACVGGKQATLWEYIWGKKELSSLPIALSLIIRYVLFFKTKLFTKHLIKDTVSYASKCRVISLTVYLLYYIRSNLILNFI